MRHTSYVLALSACLTVFLTGCSAAAQTGRSPLGLVGCTPGGPEIKAAFGIPDQTAVDFVRWSVSLSEPNFSLSINYGVGQPNTKGFIGGGEKKTVDGSYSVSNSPRGEILRLESKMLKTPLTLLKFNDNVFHFLASDETLLNGTSGWSYSLTRAKPVQDTRQLVSKVKTLTQEVWSSVVFTGRTPCFDFGREDLPSTRECLKLKWKLTLYRDGMTHEPSTYRLETTVNRSAAIEGKWKVIKGAAENPHALIIRLDPDTVDRSISFFVADDNVLLLLDRQQRPVAGNEDFSFTLNRSQRM